MASFKSKSGNEFDHEAVLVDIEGTTTPISFVKVCSQFNMQNLTLWLYVRQPGKGLKKTKCPAARHFFMDLT